MAAFRRATSAATSPGLENWVIATLKTFGIKGETREGRVGIWVVTGTEEKKIGAIGVRVSRWVSWHGLALNVHPDLRISTASCPAASASMA